MERTSVTSSNVVSVGYDPEARVLEVEFKGGVYRYLDVPADVHAGLMAPGVSVGSFLAREIKQTYVCEKVG